MSQGFGRDVSEGSQTIYRPPKKLTDEDYNCKIIGADENIYEVLKGRTTFWVYD